MGYKNATLRLLFPELETDDGTEVFVLIKNPKKLPSNYFEDVYEEPEPQPKPDQAAPDETDKQTLAREKRNADRHAVWSASEDARARRVSMNMYAKLVIDWHVFSGRDDAPDEPLGLPATGDMVASLPGIIVGEISEQYRAASNPR